MDEVCLCLVFFFFFSSRRRHTRFDCDWSSDVCSSDLFVNQYLAGRTPIACTNCNTDVKFEPLLRMARQIGAERLATGHYARIRKNEEIGRASCRERV